MPGRTAPGAENGSDQQNDPITGQAGRGERTMRLMRSARDVTVEEAIRLITSKWDLTNVVVQGDEIASPASDFDWDAALSQSLELEYEESAVTIIWRG